MGDAVDLNAGLVLGVGPLVAITAGPVGRAGVPLVVGTIPRCWFVVEVPVRVELVTGAVVVPVVDVVTSMNAVVAVVCTVTAVVTPVWKDWSSGTALDGVKAKRRSNANCRNFCTGKSWVLRSHLRGKRRRKRRKSWVLGPH